MQRLSKSGNGDPNPPTVKLKLQDYSDLVARVSLLSRMGFQHYNGDRDLYNALGYPKTVTYQDYYDRYLHQDLAKAVIDRPVKAAWQGPVEVIESGKAEETPLEKEWRLLCKQLSIKSILTRMDRLSSIGQYGVLLLGLDDVTTLEDFQKPVTPNRKYKLLYLKPFGEGEAPIDEFEIDPKNDRYGMPKFYSLQTTDMSTKGNSTVKVHYSRILHIVLDALGGDVYGIPFLEAIFNRLMDIEKLVGGDAEMFWRGARPGYSGNVDPDFQMTPEMREEIKNQVKEYENNLRRILISEGLSLESLAQQIADPANHVDVQIQMISAVTGIPKRILTGSERGQLSSDQDKAEWNTYVKVRREELCEPLILRPFINKLIELKVLPKAKSENGYDIRWQDVFAASEKDRVDIGKSRAQALNYYASAPMAEAVIPPDLFAEYFLGLTPDQIELAQELRAKAMNDELLMSPPELDETDTEVARGQQQGSKAQGKDNRDV